MHPSRPSKVLKTESVNGNKRRQVFISNLRKSISLGTVVDEHNDDMFLPTGHGSSILFHNGFVDDKGTRRLLTTKDFGLGRSCYKQTPNDKRRESRFQRFSTTRWKTQDHPNVSWIASSSAFELWLLRKSQLIHYSFNLSNDHPGKPFLFCKTGEFLQQIFVW